MLNNLTNKIKQKQLYLTVKPSKKVTNTLYSLLASNIISGFYTCSKKKATFVVAFVNYSCNFDSVISGVSTTSDNNNVDKKKLNSNFVVNVNNVTSHKFKNKIKFR